MAEIVYDPDTNSYINTANDTILTTQPNGDVMRYPIDDTGAEINDTTQDAPEAPIVVQDETIVTDTDGEEILVTTIVSDPLADVEPVAVVATASDTIISVPEAMPSTSVGFAFQTATIAELDVLKNDNRELLLAYL